MLNSISYKNIKEKNELNRVMLTFSIIFAIFCFLSQGVHATSVMSGTNYPFADPSGIYSSSDKKY